MVACRVTSSALHRLQGSQACWCELAARRLGGSPAAPGSGRHSEKMAGGAQPSSRRPALKPVRPQPFPARTQPTLVVPSPSHALSHARISPPLRQTSSPGLLASTVNRYLNAAVLFFHINCRGSLFVPQVTIVIGLILLCSPLSTKSLVVARFAALSIVSKSYKYSISVCSHSERQRIEPNNRPPSISVPPSPLFNERSSRYQNRKESSRHRSSSAGIISFRQPRISHSGSKPSALIATTLNFLSPGRQTPILTGTTQSLLCALSAQDGPPNSCRALHGRHGENPS